MQDEYGRPVMRLDDDDRKLGYYSPRDNMTLHVRTFARREPPAACMHTAEGRTVWGWESPVGADVAGAAP